MLVFDMTSCSSQHFLKHIPDYIDIGLTSKMVDSLKKGNANSFLLFLTTINIDQINDNLIGNKDSIEVTYFIWKQDEKIHVTLITDSSIYKDLILSTDTAFKYPYLNKTWLQEDEDIYQFVCPINTPNSKNIVIYITPSSKMFFEIGENLSYKLNPSRNKYRNELIILLKKTLTTTNNKWVKLSDYDRWLDFSEKKE